MSDSMKTQGALVLKESETPIGPYVYASQLGGMMALILPYRKKMGTAQYLLRRELIPCWDSHMDICGISVMGEQSQLETLLIEALKNESGYQVTPGELKCLGVCATDRFTDTTCFLYAVDLSRRGIAEEKLEVAEEMSFWGTAEDVLESVDSQLITCYAKAQYLVL